MALGTDLSWWDVAVSRAHVPGGAGWHLDARSLRPVIDDVAAFRVAHADDDAVEALVALWTGRPAEAEVLLRALPGRDTPRVRALLADAARDLGRHAEALTAYADLVRESAGTSWEAVMHQHHGKALLAAGRTAEAVRAFEQALTLRLAQGASEDLVASSRAALERAREHDTAD